MLIRWWEIADGAHHTFHLSHFTQNMLFKNWRKNSWYHTGGGDMIWYWSECDDSFGWAMVTLSTSIQRYRGEKKTAHKQTICWSQKMKEKKQADDAQFWMWMVFWLSWRWRFVMMSIFERYLQLTLSWNQLSQP